MSQAKREQNQSSNPLEALLGLLASLADRMKGATERARHYEIQLQAFIDKIPEYESLAGAWLDSQTQKAEQYAFDDLHESLRKYNVYNKLRDQDFTELICWPEEGIPGDTQAIQDFMDLKLDQLESFLQPLKIRKGDELFEQGKAILMIVVDMPENLDFQDKSAVEQFRALKLLELKPMIEAWVKLLMTSVEGEEFSEDNFDPVPAETPAPKSPTPNPSTASLEQLETQLPELEAQFRGFDAQDPTVEAVRRALQELLPLVHPIVAPLLPASVAFDQEKIHNLLDQLAVEVAALWKLGEERLAEEITVAQVTAIIQEALPHVQRIVAAVLGREVSWETDGWQNWLSNMGEEVAALITLIQEVLAEEITEITVKDALLELFPILERVTELIAPGQVTWNQALLAELANDLTPGLVEWMRLIQLEDVTNWKAITVVKTLQSLWPLLQKILAGVPATQAWTSADPVTPFLSKLAEQAQTWETTDQYKIPLLIRWLKEHLEPIAETSAWYPLRSFTARVHDWVDDLVQKGLWVPVRFHEHHPRPAGSASFEVPDDILQQMQPVSSEETTTTKDETSAPISLASTSETQKTHSMAPEPTSLADTTSSLMPETEAPQKDLPPLLQRNAEPTLEAAFQNLAVEGVAQLPPAQQEQAQSLLGLAWLEPILSRWRRLLNRFRVRLALYRGAASRRPAGPTLNAWVTWLLQEAQENLRILLRHIVSWVKLIIKEFVAAIHLLMRYLQGFKVPLTTNDQTETINVFCLVLGVFGEPWAAIINPTA